MLSQARIVFEVNPGAAVAHGEVVDFEGFANAAFAEGHEDPRASQGFAGRERIGGDEGICGRAVPLAGDRLDEAVMGSDGRGETERPGAKLDAADEDGGGRALAWGGDEGGT